MKKKKKKTEKEIELNKSWEIKPDPKAFQVDVDPDLWNPEKKKKK